MNTKISPLESWLTERANQRLIEDEYPLPPVDDVEDVEDTEELEPGDQSRGSLSECNPEVGEVRLLAPWDKDLLSRPPAYVLIMQQLDARSFLVVPFSRYTQPATQREFLTTAPDALEPATRNFRTICLWNSFVVSTNTLQKSWSFGKLSETDFQSAERVFQWIQAADLDRPLTSNDLPESLQSRIGPPLTDLDPMALFEVVTYLAEEQSWPEKIDLTGLAVAEEAVPATAEIPESTRLAIPWRDLLKSAARVPEGLGRPEDLARRFAVWVSDSPASQILQNAGKATLSLLEEATSFWEKVLPKSEPGQLRWETKKSMIWSGGSQSLEPSYGFMGGVPPSRRRSVTLEHTPDLPSGRPVLLLDGRTSQLLGRGETSKSGIQIHLLTEIPPDAPLQLVLCKNEPPPEDFI